MKKQSHDLRRRLVRSMITILLFVVTCSLTLSTLAVATDKIHLDDVPYVVQKERLD